jgi:hypothetical protein
MQRRDVLAGSAVIGAEVIGAKVVGAGALGGVLQSGCAGPLTGAPPAAPSLPVPASPVPADMDVYCDELEAKLAGMAKSEFVDGFVARLAKNQPLSAERRAKIEANEALFRRSLSSLFLTQTFRDLPVEAQRHPRLQALMHERLPEVDQTVFDVTDMLETLDPEQRQALRRELASRPDLPLQLSEAIDERAAAAGVSSNRRRQLRSMLTQASFRLRHAAPDTLIDEYTAKVRRATAPGGAAQAMALHAAARATEDLFFSAQVAGAAAPAGSGAVAASAAVAPAATSSPAPRSPASARPASAARRRRTGTGAGRPAPASEPSATVQPGEGTMITGAWLLGIGVVTFGVSAAIVSAGGTALLVGATIGALLFAIGLIVLLVGAIIYAVN